MTGGIEDEIDIDWILDAIRKHNPHVTEGGDEFSHFTFDSPAYGIAATVYADGFIPVNETHFIRFQEPQYSGIGANNPFTTSVWRGDEDYNIRQIHWYQDRVAYDRTYSPVPFGLAKLTKQFPAFFEEEKKLILLDGSQDEHQPDHVKRIIKDIQDAGKDPWDYVFMRVLLGSNSYNEGETLFEYLAGLHFINEGYLATNHGSTGADLHVYRYPELSERFGGRFAVELLLDPTHSGFHATGEERAYAIEVEPTSTRTLSSGGSGIGQIKKQNYHEPFSGAISAGPAERPRSSSLVGTLLYGRNTEKIVEYPTDPKDIPSNTTAEFREYVKHMLLEQQYEEQMQEASGLSEYIMQLADTDLGDLG